MVPSSTTVAVGVNGDADASLAAALAAMKETHAMLLAEDGQFSFSGRQ